jgi:hypothetical protein
MCWIIRKAFSGEAQIETLWNYGNASSVTRIRMSQTDNRTNKSGKVCFNGLHIFSKHVLCDFTYLIGLDDDLLQ